MIVRGMDGKKEWRRLERETLYSVIICVYVEEVERGGSEASKRARRRRRDSGSERTFITLLEGAASGKKMIQWISSSSRVVEKSA